LAVEYKTKSFRKSDVERNWYIVDASDKTLGRLATKVASILHGKTKPQFTPHNDVGDFVVVINADKVKLSGKKADTKMYYHNTLYPGGAVFVKYKDMISKKPEAVIEHAVRGMLPKNSLGEKMFKKLKVYAGSGHPHSAQKPKLLEI
jgi:large subunit ribosomal protein L13